MQRPTTDASHSSDHEFNTPADDDEGNDNDWDHEPNTVLAEDPLQHHTPEDS